MRHTTTTRRRQWGAEKRLQPLPSVPPVPSDRKVTLGRLAIGLTVLFWAGYVMTTIVRQGLDGHTHGFRFTTEAAGYLLTVTVLTFSALMYLVARQGALERYQHHVRVPRAELDRHFAQEQPSMTVLVPSYAEEPDVVRMTLLSAALQEYPRMRVVLLLDDDPNPRDREAAERLEAARRLPEEVAEFLAEPRSRFAAARWSFELVGDDRAVGAEDAKALAAEYDWAAGWLGRQADGFADGDHVHHFFAHEVLGGLAGDLTATAQALRAAAAEGAQLERHRMTELYRRLTWIFQAELVVFQRKCWASLPHDANKAMNLNAYIGLMGGVYRPEDTPDGPILTPVNRWQRGDVVIPDADFLLTLDADSILVREYCLRLVYFLQQPDNSRVAVTQTPYSAFRGAATRVERLAGATTDIQHILHQGMTRFGATFWVGANAVIRKKALEEIRQTEIVGGFPVHRFVQDHTVIEDTESSIDLGNRGWSLVNYPERLSYSATPPDFGSLIVQRRRWADGGLLIIPKLLRQVRTRRRRRKAVPILEFLLRVNYMGSIAWTSLGLVFLLAYPYTSRLLSPLVIMAALPYFLAMASDLHATGYRRLDVIRIYGFNLILLPVNIAGVLKSLQQALTGKKIPFARTPKVDDRTASPALYVLAPFGIVAFSVFTLWRDALEGNWANAAFALFNAAVTLWAIVSHIGLGHAVVDAWLGLTKYLYVERTVAPKSAAVPEPVVPAVDWQAVLYFGPGGEKGHGARHSALPYAERKAA